MEVRGGLASQSKRCRRGTHQGGEPAPASAEGRLVCFPFGPPTLFSIDCEFAFFFWIRQSASISQAQRILGKEQRAPGIHSNAPSSQDDQRRGIFDCTKSHSHCCVRKHLLSIYQPRHIASYTGRAHLHHRPLPDLLLVLCVVHDPFLFGFLRLGLVLGGGGRHSHEAEGEDTVDRGFGPEARIRRALGRVGGVGR